MLIIGAKGFAKEILQSLQGNNIEQLAFYDDVNKDAPEKLYDQYPVLHNRKQAEKYFNDVDQHFTLGIGNSLLRYKLYKEFSELGGIVKSTISNTSNIGIHTTIKKGCNILAGVHISNGAYIGRGALIYYNVIITHDVEIGDFVELSPGCKLLGRVRIKDRVQVGSGAIILPGLTIGENAIIGAGAVVTKNVETNAVVVGNPAKRISNG